VDTLRHLCALCASVVKEAISPQRHRGHRVILGVRYALPLYVPLTLAAAAGAATLFHSGSRDLRRAAILLIGLHVAVSLYAHPDYFPYFNVLAGRGSLAQAVEAISDRPLQRNV
jgi:hypothetical protein